MFGKRNLFLARLPGILLKSSDNYRRYNFHAFGNISGNFRKINNPILTYELRSLRAVCNGTH